MNIYVQRKNTKKKNIHGYKKSKYPRKRGNVNKNIKCYSQQFFVQFVLAFLIVPAEEVVHLTPFVLAELADIKD